MFWDFLVQPLMMCASIVSVDEDLESFETRIKEVISSVQYKYVIILIANYHSQSKAVRSILENFTTIDMLSKDIDFHFPGYRNDKATPIIPNRETIQKALLAEAISQLDSFSKEKDFSFEKLNDIKTKLSQISIPHEQSDADNYHGQMTLTKINSKRLGKIYFSDETFANFVSELVKKSNGKYKYYGGCDLVMIPYYKEELQYSDCSVYRLENIANKETQISIDSFLLRVIDTLSQNNHKLHIPHIRNESFELAINKFKVCITELDLLLQDAKDIPVPIKEILTQSGQLIHRSERYFVRMFNAHSIKEQAMNILDKIQRERDYVLNHIVTRNMLDQLYKEATKEISFPTEKEIITKIVSDIELHVHWKLSENFYFISYSTKDKVKAELIRRKLQEHGVKVWIAPDGIPQGRDYSMIIPTTLRYAKNFVLILTENSAKSKWVSREIDAAINNSSTNLKIILTNGFQLNQLKSYPDLGFYLNKVQVSYRYEDIIQNAETFARFIK